MFKLMIGLTICVCIAQMVYWYGRLPDPIPSHFDENGQVDGQMGKAAFYVFIGLMHVLFLIGFPILGNLLRRLPDSMINIPNKAYWLDPQWREETLSLNVGVVNATGWMTSCLIIGIFQLTALVGVNQRELITPEFWWLLGVYMVGVFSIVIWLLLRFRLPDIDPNVQMQ